MLYEKGISPSYIYDDDDINDILIKDKLKIIDRIKEILK